MDTIDAQLIEPTSYKKYLDLRDATAGYSDDGEELLIKRFRSFRIHYGYKETRKFFIDDFCSKCEEAYGGFVNYYSQIAEKNIREKYGSYIDVTRNIATHSDIESMMWDDEDDEDDSYNETMTVYIMTVHTYRLRLKEGKNKNELKLKYPELLNLRLFSGDDKESHHNIKNWFNEQILRKAKDSINDKEVVNVLREKAGIKQLGQV